MINARPTMTAQNKTEALVRFPNESCYEKISIDLSQFNADKSFSDETFGWYKGTYISIKK
jgi:hypothetical protein